MYKVLEISTLYTNIKSDCIYCNYTQVNPFSTHLPVGFQSLGFGRSSDLFAFYRLPNTPSVIKRFQ